MIKSAMLLICMGLNSLVHAQQMRDSSLQKELIEIVVSGNKFAEKKKNIVQKIDIISSSYIKKANAQNMGDLLMSTGNVFVQKSQQGGSSPVIRGFEASRVLFVVDGVRMNNLIYRSGHLQNIITVDQNILESVELLQGPSSTLFGSDALGGAVHMISKQPVLSKENEKTKISSHFFSRFSSANAEKTVHADVSIGWKKFGLLTSITRSDFGDSKIGKRDRKGFEGFGTRPFYIQPFNGITGDTIVKNSNDRIQRFSGYTQTDFTQKILYKPNANTSHGLNIQYSNSSDVPRYDRLQDTRAGVLRFASWYYGPQKRSLFAYNFSANNRTGFFNEYKATLSYQSIEESRITREYKRYDRFDKRIEQVGVVGLTIDARKKLKQDEITAGIDLQLNDLHSKASRTNLLTNAIAPLDSRYPDGKNRMNNFAVYTQHIHKFKGQKWILNDGLRIQYIALKSNIINNSFFSLPITDIVQKNTAITGNIGMVYMPSTSTRIKFGYASGFRAPNIDDLAKIFESSTVARQVIIPNANLKPEFTHGFDAELVKALGKAVEFEVGAFYTNFTNAIIKAPFRLNGKDSINYYGVQSQVLASQNINQAYILGGNVRLSVKAGKYWKFNSTFNFTKGRFRTDATKSTLVYQLQSNGNYALVQSNVGSKPLDHIPPSFGKISMGYDNQELYAELTMLFNGWKKLDQYNADGEDNAQYATAKGTPAWQTLNLKTGLQLNKRIGIHAAVENIFDLNYRYFASGFSAPGRNWIISLRLSL
ncbi:MAG: TonB-dependent receptor [Chitinophagaceae bacterium]|nr:TonB-dependent receptor [Chitinophagaceae bacterium]